MVVCALLVNLADSSSVLWNRNYFLRFWFRFRLLTSYGSGSNFCQVTVPVPAPCLDHKKHSFQTNFGKNLACLHTKFFYKEKIYNSHQIYCKMGMKKMLNEVNQIHNFLPTVSVRTFVIPFYYDSGTVIKYGSGSDFLTGSGSPRQKVTVPTVPVPVAQHCSLNRCRDLALHSSQQHKNVHFCLHCSARFRTKRNLTTHLKVVHNDLEGILRYYHVFYLSVLLIRDPVPF
jgi:hypothetical protein